MVARRNAGEPEYIDPGLATTTESVRVVYAIFTGLTDPMPEGTEERIQHISRRVYRTLEMSGYARIDLRLDRQGRIYVLEANPNPQIARYEDFARSADCAGYSYPALIQKILQIGLRWEPGRHG